MFLNIDCKPLNAVAVIDDGGNSITYGEIATNCKEFSNLINKRELVFCLCENSAGSLLGFLALYENSDVPLLLNARIDRQLLCQLIRIYQPTYLWLPERFLGEFELEAVDARYGYVLGKTKYSACKMNDKLSLLLTTSGSTGSQKLVRHKYGNIEKNAENVARVFGWNERERPICDLPMQYTMGLNVICSSLYAGATVLLLSSNLMSPTFWRFIKEHEATNFTGVAYSYQILLKLKFTRMQLPRLTTFAQGGEKLPATVFSELATFAKQSGKRFFATFGTTETSARIAYLAPELSTEKCCSIGRAIPEGELFLLDDEGKEIVGTDVEGELGYRGPNVTMGYALCREDLQNDDEFCGEYHTGDIARRDKDGCYYIIGRKNRFLKLYGLRISLEQCERLINEEFNTECACAGDDKCMTIFVTDSKCEQEIKTFIGQKTGLLGSAFSVKVINEFPRNESGKITYKELVNQ